MTKLFVRAIDNREQGSHRLRRKWRNLFTKVQELQGELKCTEGDDDKQRPVFVQLARLQDEMEDFLEGRCYTDDETPVQDALDTISADDFDALWKAIGAESSVPEVSASS